MEIKRTQQSFNITQVETDQRTEVKKQKPVVPNQIPDSFEDASLRKDTTSQRGSIIESVKVDSKSQELLLKQLTSRLLEPGIKRTQEKPLAAKTELATNEQKAKLEAAIQNRMNAETQQSSSQRMASGGGRPSAKADEAEKEENKSTSYTVIDSFTAWRTAPIVIEGSKDDVPENVPSLGMYESGKDLISVDDNYVRLRRFEQFSEESGGGYANAQLNIISLRGRISYEAATPDQNGSLTGGIAAEGQTQVIAAYFEAGSKTLPLNIAGHDLSLKGEIDVKAEAGAKFFVIAEASAGKDTYVHLGSSVFVGANTEVEVKQSAGEYGDARAGLGLGVGFGIGGTVQAGVKDGKFVVDVNDLGMAVGVGATVDAGFSVDISEVTELRDETAEAGFELARNFWESRSEAAGEFANDAAKTSRGVVEDIKESADEFAEEAIDTAEDVAGEAYETAEGAVETAVDTATDAAEDTAEDIEDAWNDFWD